MSTIIGYHPCLSKASYCESAATHTMGSADTQNFVIFNVLVTFLCTHVFTLIDVQIVNLQTLCYYPIYSAMRTSTNSQKYQVAMTCKKTSSFVSKTLAILNKAPTEQILSIT